MSRSYRLVLLFFLIVACSPLAHNTGTIVRSGQSRDLAPNAPPDAVAAVVAGNTDFAFDLYRALNGAEGNLFFSPYSISSALAMLQAGARGETERQLAATLRYDLPPDQLHPAVNGLDLQLEPGADDNFKLASANSVWGQDGYSFRQDYLDLLARQYGAGLRLTDFASDPEGARDSINAWVDDETAGAIKELLPDGSLSSESRLVLVNAIVFNAAWQDRFDPGSLTGDSTFRLIDGGSVEADMMSREEASRYLHAAGYDAAEINYKGGKLSMIVIMPKPGQFAEVERALSRAFLDGLEASLSSGHLTLTMPKFKFGATFELAETLADLGAPDAFTAGAADFSGIDGTADLVVDKVVHQAVVAVDERGTEAAAATGATLKQIGAALDAPSSTLTVNRPFIFLIRDRRTGSVLFLGRVMDPTR